MNTNKWKFIKVGLSGSKYVLEKLWKFEQTDNGFWGCVSYHISTSLWIQKEKSLKRFLCTVIFTEDDWLKVSLKVFDHISGRKSEFIFQRETPRISKKNQFYKYKHFNWDLKFHQIKSAYLKKITSSALEYTLRQTLTY